MLTTLVLLFAGFPIGRLAPSNLNKPTSIPIKEIQSSDNTVKILFFTQTNCKNSVSPPQGLACQGSSYTPVKTGKVQDQTVDPSCVSGDFKSYYVPKGASKDSILTSITVKEDSNECAIKPQSTSARVSTFTVGRDSKSLSSGCHNIADLRCDKKQLSRVNSFQCFQSESSVADSKADDFDKTWTPGMPLDAHSSTPSNKQPQSHPPIELRSLEDDEEDLRSDVQKREPRRKKHRHGQRQDDYTPAFVLEITASGCSKKEVPMDLKKRSTNRDASKDVNVYDFKKSEEKAKVGSGENDNNFTPGFVVESVKPVKEHKASHGKRSLKTSNEEDTDVSDL